MMDDAYSEAVRNGEAAQAIVDREMPPLPFHPMTAAVVVAMIAAVTLMASGAPLAMLETIPVALGIGGLGLCVLWDRRRWRRVECELARIKGDAGAVSNSRRTCERWPEVAAGEPGRGASRPSKA